MVTTGQHPGQQAQPTRRHGLSTVWYAADLQHTRVRACSAIRMSACGKHPGNNTVRDDMTHRECCKRCGARPYQCPNPPQDVHPWLPGYRCHLRRPLRPSTPSRARRNMAGRTQGREGGDSIRHQVRPQHGLWERHLPAPAAVLSGSPAAQPRPPPSAQSPGPGQGPGPGRPARGRLHPPGPARSGRMRLPPGQPRVARPWVPRGRRGPARSAAALRR
jgi:hypothetical protein